MCTVTFLPRKRGYLLGMNRDELRTRARGLPPAIHRVDSCSALYPSEPGGGTWISLNNSGVTFALINWYAAPRRVTTKVVSRGSVITSIRMADAPEVVASGLAKLPLPKLNPF